MRWITINRKNIDYISEYDDRYIIHFNGGKHIEVCERFEVGVFEVHQDLGLGTSEEMKGKTMTVDTTTYIIYYQISDFVKVPLYEVGDAN